MGNKIRIKQIDLQGIFSASSQVDILSASNYASFVTQLDTTMSSDAELSAVSSSISQSIYTINQVIGSGLVSGSSQLTSSYDTRYILSGSITQTTWDNIEGKPSGLVSQSTDLTSLNSKTGSYATTGSNTFNGNQTITGSVSILIPGGTATGVNENPTSNNVFWSLPSQDTNTLNVAIGWTAVVQGGGTYTVTNVELNTPFAPFVAITLSDPSLTLGYRVRLDFSKNSKLWQFNTDGTLTGLPSGLISGSSQISGFGFISQSTDITSLNTFTASYFTDSSSFDTRVLTEKGRIDAILSASTADIDTFAEIVSLINSVDLTNDNAFATFYTSSNSRISSLENATGSYITSLNGAISSSSQLTSSFDTRYTLSGSVQPLPNELISGSSQLTSSFDERYTLSSSYSADSSSFNSRFNGLVTTGSNTFSGSQVFSGSITVTSGQVIASTITNNSSSLFLQSGSNLYVQNNGIVEITGSIVLNGTTYTSLTGSGTIPTGTISGSSQLTSSFDTRYLNAGGDGVWSGSAQVTGNLAVTNVSASVFVGGYLVPEAKFTVLSSKPMTFWPNITYELVRMTTGGGVLIGRNGETNDYGNRLDVSGSVRFTGNTTITGSLIVTNGITGSIAATNGVISGSSQLTSSFDTRYTLSGSVVSGTTPAGTISGSSQLTSSFDGRYVQTGSFNSLTASFNSFTASAQSVTTGSNSFNGTQTITGSLIITTGSFFASQITANTASLYLTSGSNLYVQNNGVLEVTGSLNVSNTTTLKGAINIGTGSGFEGGEIQLAYAQTGNTTLTGSAIAFDVYQDKIRMFEGGGTNRGAYLNVASQSAGVGSEIITSPNISSMQTITSASYAALTPVSGTLYIIIG